MSTSSGQPQFRYTQTPSKVLHLRNLPWECTEEELVELCKPFGKIVNTKCNVGPNRNQAFVEFVDLNQAISMVSYYASSSEPAQVRGKTVYIQYSNRQEVVNNKSTGDVAGNVLLVTIEGVEAGDVSIDVIHLVCVRFDVQLVDSNYISGVLCFWFCAQNCYIREGSWFSGEMSTIALEIFLRLLLYILISLELTVITYFQQALIQFSDAETAASARNALDGRSIPRQGLVKPAGQDTALSVMLD
ncbi:hypothetical protein HHK36_024670 [Tetracentron sinense]|uniref:RRM domain-containing protein n=1 Tax=Tetracentron sinense TaxID=13715 RepID=A0A835D4G5_TETSI|nr:hypothetical protein HHK36_024670 [Tetracentron sinense]